MKDSGWRFCKKNSMTMYFYKTVEKNSRSYVKIPLRSSAIMQIKNDDKYCFLWSILTHLHPCNNNHPNRVSNYGQFFFELNFEGFDFTNGLKCSDVHMFEKLNNLSINIFELNFYQNQKKWRHELVPIEVKKSISVRVLDLLFYKTQYVLIKKLHIFLRNHNCNFGYRRCLYS